MMEILILLFSFAPKLQQHKLRYMGLKFIKLLVKHTFFPSVWKMQNCPLSML